MTDRNRELAELVGMFWHHAEDFNVRPFYPLTCSCGEKLFTFQVEPHCKHYNPDFTADPRLVLREMVKRDDWLMFLAFIKGLMDVSRHHDKIDVGLILDTTGKLANLAIEFLLKMRKR